MYVCVHLQISCWGYAASEALLVGLWPGSDKVFPLTSVQEQC